MKVDLSQQDYQFGNDDEQQQMHMIQPKPMLEAAAATPDD